MKVLVTGATGRVGANLCQTLVEKGYQVRGLVQPESKRAGKADRLKSLGVEIVTGDLRNYEDMVEAVRGVQVICHMAALLGGHPVAAQFDVNLRGTFYLLEAAANNTKALNRFVFASSDVLLPHSGFQPMPVSEEAPVPSPLGMYSFTKWAGEKLCYDYYKLSGLPMVSLRFAYILGAGELVKFRNFYLSKTLESYRPNKGASDQVDRALAILEALWPGEERLVILRTEEGIAWKKHFVDVRDLIQGVVLAIGCDAANGEAITLASPPVRWDEAVPYMSQKLEIPYVDARVPLAPTYYEYDISKARRLLGYQPQHDFRRMVDDAVALERGEDIGLVPT